MTDTFVKLLAENRKLRGESLAWRRKRHGIWEEYSWKDIYEKVKLLSLGLASAGVRKGESVSILGDADPEWFWAELAAQLLGATVVGLSPDASPNESKDIIALTESKIVFAADQEQVDKVLDIKNELPFLRNVIFWRARGIRGYGQKEALLTNYENLMVVGKECEKRSPDFFETKIDETCGTDIALILFTAGVDGKQKGVPISYDMILDWAKASSRLFSIKPGDNYLCLTQPSWILEQLISLAYSLLYRSQMNFPEDTETVLEDLIELSPEFLSAPVALWENISSEIQAGLNKTSPVKKMISNLSFSIRRKVIDQRLKEKKSNLVLQFLDVLAEIMFFQPLKSRHGLHRASTALTSGCMMGFEMYTFFHVLGVNLRTVYVLSESGIITAQEGFEPIPGSVGFPVEGVSIKISDDGEILVTREMICERYYKKVQGSESAFDDSWFCTGDAGLVGEKGNLIFMGRLLDLKTLRSRLRFSPELIEASLKFSPYIKEAIVDLDRNREYALALLTIDLMNVGEWAEKNGLAYVSFNDLSQKPEVIDLVSDGIIKVNQSLPKGIEIRKFVSLPREMSLEKVIVSRVGKFQRKALEESYRELISAMSEDKSEITIHSAATDGDKEKELIPARIRINPISG